MTIATDVDVEFRRIIAAEFTAQPPDANLIGVWLTHRVCAPEHAAAVYRRCLTDRRILPRWHQDDRGERNTIRGFHQSAPDGAYRGITAWSGRNHWLTVVVPTIVGARPDVLAKHHVAPDTLARWARVKSGYADQRNGRRCIVRPETVASVMGMEKTTVMRCQRAARELGLEVVVMAGRMLNYAERARAERWGSRQRGLSNETALTIPAEVRQEVASRQPAIASRVDHATPSRGGKLEPKTHLLHINRDGLRPTQKVGAPRRPRAIGGRDWRDACRLASEVASAVSWLAGEGRRRLAPPLMRYVTAETPWTAAQLVSAVERATAGRGVIDPSTIRTRPAILFAAILRRIDPVLDHPTSGGAFAIPEPCGNAACDGHGWINGVDEQGHRWARPCPDCAPSLRAVDANGDHGCDPWQPGDGSAPF